jgi:glycosyltransferase involved in cell wall biosynthesis
VPFVTGGAELHVRALTTRLQERGYEVDRVALPFKWYPKDEMLAHAAAWRLLDLTESNGRPIDRVLVTKFPAYFVRHPYKVAWLMHQHRAAYDLCGTAYSDFDHVEADVALRARLIELDTGMLGECRHLFTGATNIARRLERYNGLHAEALYHPPALAERLRAGPYGDYVLVVGRLESVKRVDLAIAAMNAVDGPVRLVVVGDGTQRTRFETEAVRLGVTDRVTFTGVVSDQTLIELYADALAVVFVPFDEDYGYVTLEAFLARKPVITASDSGGPLEFVEDGVSGTVCDPRAESIAEAINTYARNRGRAAAHGAEGYDRAHRITWDRVVDRLLFG